MTLIMMGEMEREGSRTDDEELKQKEEEEKESNAHTNSDTFQSAVIL